MLRQLSELLSCAFKRVRRRPPQKRPISAEQLEDRRVLATFWVTTISDSGAGSLRQAILDANASPGTDEVHFNISGASRTLQPSSLLPEIVDALIIDATTQPGYMNQPLVQIDGSLVPSGDGLLLSAGNSTIRGLSITGFRRAGIFIDGAGDNVIERNFIGVDRSGAKAVPNQFAGIIVSDSKQNHIGGATVAAGNLISGNAGDGLRIEGALSVDNVVQGNSIGTDVTGLAAIPNRTVGVLVQGGARRTTIGADSDGQNDEQEGNLISGNLGSAIELRDATTRNVVAGNWLGIDRSGNQEVRNVWWGVGIFGNSQDNLIGIENGVGRANVISGNRVGVYIEASHQNVVAGNLIGLNSSGNQAIGNANQGVWVTAGSQRNRIGTDDNGRGDVSERNVISGNVQQGISISGEGTDSNWIAGNLIGTDPTGLAAIPNTSTGVQITNFAQFNRVGRRVGALPGSMAGNVISGNSAWGIRFRNHASDNFVAGNLIGTDITGMASLPNGSSGIGTFELAKDNLIGGNQPQLRNTISGNLRWGVEVEPFSGSNVIVGNFIGLAADGVTPLGNSTGGVVIDSAKSNQIGDGTPAGSNRIAFNAAVGIQILGSTATENIISANQIYAQTMGIDLSGDGVTPNDLTDSDAGPNDLQNFPEIRHFLSSGGVSSIAGTMQGVPQSEYRIELFAVQQVADLGPGARYLGSVTTRTDHRGYSSWQADFPATLHGEYAVTATARDVSGNTSEFSAAKHLSIPLELAAERSLFAEDAGAVQLKVGRGSLALSSEVVVALSGLPSEIGAVPAEVVIAPGEAFATVSMVIYDDSVREADREFILFADGNLGAATAVLRLAVVDDDTGDWHNGFLPEDINGDRIVSPLDVLLIVNYLNSNSNPFVSQLPPALPRAYLDTDNSGYVSPTDVLLVINYLNRGALGEGEAHAELVENRGDLWWGPWDSFENKRFRLWPDRATLQQESISQSASAGRLRPATR